MTTYIQRRTGIGLATLTGILAGIGGYYVGKPSKTSKEPTQIAAQASTLEKIPEHIAPSNNPSVSNESKTEQSPISASQTKEAKSAPKPVKPSLDVLVDQFSHPKTIQAPYPVFRQQLTTLLNKPTSPDQKKKIYTTVDQYLSTRTVSTLGIRYDEIINGRKETVSWGMHYPSSWQKEKIRIAYPYSELSPYLSQQQKIQMALSVQPRHEPGPFLRGYTPLEKQATAQLLQNRFKDGKLPKGATVRELTDRTFSLYPANAELIRGYAWTSLK